MKIVIAGGTGFVGRALVKRLLEDHHKVVVLSRRVDAFKERTSADLKVEAWDGQTVGAWASQLEGADAVVNLSGEGIADKRWSSGRKKALRESRVNSTRALVVAIAGAGRTNRQGRIPAGSILIESAKLQRAHDTACPNRFPPI